MAFRYINPGYGALTGDSSVTTFESFTYNPTNGVAFFKDNSTLLIPTSGAFTTDIYGKFDFYWQGSRTLYIGADSLSTYYSFLGRMLGLFCNINNDKIFFYFSRSQYGNGIKLNKNSLNSIWFHIHRNDENSILSGEMIVNGEGDSYSLSDATYDSYKFSTEKYFGI